MLLIGKIRYGVAVGFVLLVTFLSAPVLFAEVPDLINYQGHLADADGNPVPDGTYAMNFELCTTESGETGVWSQTMPAVSVVGGVFNVQLGPFIYPVQVFDGDLYLEVEVNGEILIPRQRLSATAYAMRAVVADGVANGAVTAVMLADAAVTETKVAAGAITADKIVGGSGSGVDADRLDGHDTAYFATATTVTALQSQVATLQTQVNALVALLANVTRSGNDITFSGVNIRIVNGTGTTDGPVNGLGNLIVGYNEARSSGNDRTGSHNIVAGTEHNYASFGGLVVGRRNTISGQYSSVSGGLDNTASGDDSSVSGGINNTASGDGSSVSGGNHNTAIGFSSIVVGGFNNQARGDVSCVSGSNNTSSGNYSSVSGGHGNIASGYSASVSGGSGNTASGYRSSVSGGSVNIASGEESSVTGGRANHAEGLRAAVHGGYGNHAWSEYTAVLGGQANYAGNPADATHVQGRLSTVSGGYDNDAFGNFASVLGGASNPANVTYSTNLGDATLIYYNSNPVPW